MFNDAWMADQGFLPQERHNDLRDLMTRRWDKGQVVTVGPEDTLLTAYKRMRISDVSQLPVMEGDRFKDKVYTAMVNRLVTVPVTADMATLTDLFDRNMVAIMVDGDRFLGVLTRMDMLNFLRRQMA